MKVMSVVEWAAARLPPGRGVVHSSAPLTQVLTAMGSLRMTIRCQSSASLMPTLPMGT